MQEPYKDMGGPAHPLSYDLGGGNGRMVHLGMALRDYFAAQALPAYLAPQPAHSLASSAHPLGAAWGGIPQQPSVTYMLITPEEAAKRAYAAADAMLVERGRQS